MARMPSSQRERGWDRIEQKVHKRQAATHSRAHLKRSLQKKSRQGRVQKKAQSAQLELKYYDKHFQHWVNYFGQKKRKLFIRYLKRASRYEKVVHQIFEEYGLPKDLFFVGLIESGFSLGAFSRAKALGPWQFMKGTGKRYGLRVNRQVDERKNIYKATEAAAHYFKDLYNIFGSWELALCAYNSGEYRVINAIRKGNSRDYRVLIRKKLLPRETVYYIPKVAAARFLTQKKEFKKYLSSFPSQARDYLTRKEIFLYRPFSLLNLAQKSGFSYRKLKKFNPDIRWNKVYPGRRPFRLMVPRKGYSLIRSVLRQDGKTKSRGRLKQRRYYRVQKGDSLSEIALRFNQSISQLRRWNQMRGSQIFIGQKLRVGNQRIYRQHQITSSSKLKRKNKVIYHRVKRGQTLGQLGKRYGVRMNSLRRYNNLKGNQIYIGQVLKIPKGGRARKIYVVRKGDNLFKIAQRFGTSINEIKRINSFKGKTIYPQQKIIIPRKS